MNLDVAISTHLPSGIEKVEKMLPHFQKGVRYVISWQNHQDYPVPANLQNREDVTVIRYSTNGLSNNRNHSISHCNGDVILLADDDLVFQKDFAITIIRSFERDESLDIGLFKIEFPFKKKYPHSDCRLSLPLPKDYYVSSVELAFRRTRIKDLKFYPKLGLGAGEMSSGEDSFFLFSALKRGYSCKFINKTIASHPQYTSGSSAKEAYLKSQGFLIAAMYPKSLLFRLPLKAYRTHKANRKPFFHNLKQLFLGARIYIKEEKDIPACCK